MQSRKQLITCGVVSDAEELHMKQNIAICMANLRSTIYRKSLHTVHSKSLQLLCNRNPLHLDLKMSVLGNDLPVVSELFERII